MIRKPHKALGVIRAASIVAAALILAAVAGLGAVKAGLGVEMAFPAGVGTAVRSRELPWNPRLNRVQSGNTCGAHSLMAYLFIRRGAIHDPYEIYDGLGSKLANGYVYPWGLTGYLSKEGLPTRIYCFWTLSDARKEEWLRRRITEGKPVILVVGDRRYLHYVTALGFSERGYDLYDSLVESDMNGGGPGNITVPARELLGRWNGAAYKGLRVKLAISD